MIRCSRIAFILAAGAVLALPMFTASTVATTEKPGTANVEAADMAPLNYGTAHSIPVPEPAAMAPIAGAMMVAMRRRRRQRAR